MTVTTQQGATPAPAGPSFGDRLRGQLAGTPGRLRQLAALSIGVSLVFGLLGAALLSWRAGALDAARGSTEQLVRLQTVRTRLVQADAEAANAFLVGGLEPAARRAAYVRSVDVASATIATAAAESDADAPTLAEVNQSLTHYTGLVEAARANNRQGLAVGATYLQQASALLRSDILPKLTRLADDNQRQVQSRYDAAAVHGRVFTLLTLLVLGALAGAQYWLAQRTRRILNVGLTAGTGVLLLAVVVAAVTMLASQSRANRAHTEAYAATVELAQARIDAFDAKSAESLTLVARGSGQAYEAEFTRAIEDARRQLDAADLITAHTVPVRQALEDFVRAHAKIRKADDGGDFPEAVRLATREGSAAAPFNRFDQTSDVELGTQSEHAVGDLRRAARPLRPVAGLVLLGGVLAAFAAARGVAARLREYR
ncbi:MAG TPA: hypothetical protein VFQ85_09490 [Mycobacteriales bacterium]|jgi:hypothetical protein|nr:hypothetical protein [Mycobacteriales bacterium]